MFERKSKPAVFYFVIQSNNMKIIRAEHLGMCFGVRDAIALALETARARAAHHSGRPGPQRNRAGGIARAGHPIEQQPAQCGHANRDDHGARRVGTHDERNARARVERAGGDLSARARGASRLAKLVREGFHPVIIGKRDHVEVRGMTEDLDEFDVVLVRERRGESAGAPAFRRHCANHAAD